MCVSEYENQLNLPETKLFTKFIVVAGLNLKYTGEWERMTAIGEFSTEYLYTGMEYTKSQIGCVFIYPIL